MKKSLILGGLITAAKIFTSKYARNVPSYTPKTILKGSQH
jgi:hypothetical protein